MNQKRLGHYSSGARKGRPYAAPLIFSDLHDFNLLREVGDAPTASADFIRTNGGKRTASSAENKPRKSLNINGMP